MASAFSPLLLRRVGLTATRLPLRRAPLRTPVLSTLKQTSGLPSLTPRSNFLHTSRILQQAGPFRPSLRLNQVAEATKASSFPAVSAKPVAYWLFFTASLVFGIVVVGGLTRLTESGLSITEWKPITGAVPPKTREDWEEEFEKYKSSPEFIKLNSKMTLEEFKFIYHMEWGHRQLGRFIGVAFVLPALYFIARKRVTGKRAINLALIGAGIGFQGALGWWMVKSGLVHENFEKDDAVPRVSQYRLTAHLGAAFLVYVGMLWNGLAILKENRIAKDAREGKLIAQAAENPFVRKTRIGVLVLTAAIFATAMSGGMVAGLDAGLVYNEFPMMGKGLTPPKAELFNDFYAHKADNSDMWWRNLFENPVTVQLEHRILAVSTFTAIVAFWALTRFRPQFRSVLNKRQLSGIAGMMHVGGLQVALGISTLIYMVPTHLAATHQANALALLTMGVLALSRFHTPAVQQAFQALQTSQPTQKVEVIQPSSEKKDSEALLQEVLGGKMPSTPEEAMKMLAKAGGPLNVNPMEIMKKINQMSPAEREALMKMGKQLEQQLLKKRA